MFRRELGSRALLAYLTGIMISAVALGLGVDTLAGWWQLDISRQVEQVQELLPAWVEALALIILIVLAVRPLRRRLSAALSRTTSPQELP